MVNLLLKDFNSIFSNRTGCLTHYNSRSQTENSCQKTNNKHLRDSKNTVKQKNEKKDKRKQTNTKTLIFDFYFNH